MKRLCIKILQIYKKHISKYFAFFGYRCKFYPTCSEYCMQAIQKYGVLRGVGLGIKRILKCHPFSKGGYDPLK